MDPKKDSRVCPAHLGDRRATAEYPFSTEKLGQDATKKTLFLSPPQKKREYHICFFNNVESVELFDELHDFIAPLAQRRARLSQENQQK